MSFHTSCDTLTFKYLTRVGEVCSLGDDGSSKGGGVSTRLEEEFDEGAESKVGE